MSSSDLDYPSFIFDKVKEESHIINTFKLAYRFIVNNLYALFPVELSSNFVSEKYIGN